MSFLMPFLVSFLAGISTVFGSFVIFFRWKREKINQFIAFCLSFSCAVMIGISVTELVPEASFGILTEFKLFKGLFLSFFIFLLGIISVLFFNQKLTKKGQNHSGLYRVGVLSMIALLLHNLPEGIVTFLSSCQDMTLGLKIGMAIMLHNIPEGISVSVPIYYSTGSKKKAIGMSLVSGLAEPLGAIVAFVFLRNFITPAMISVLLLFVAGIMITLAIHDLLPKALDYRENQFVLLGGGVGLIFILINFFFF